MLLGRLAARAEGCLRCLLEGLAGISLLSMMLITTVDVLGRFFFNAPLLGAIELMQLALAIVIFCAFPIVCWKEEHISIDLLDTWVPAWVVPWRQLVINGLCAFALYIMAGRIQVFANRAFSYGDVTEFLKIPMGYLIVLMAVMAWIAAVLCALRAFTYIPEIFGYKTWAHQQQESMTEQYLGSESGHNKNQEEGRSD
ncbi:TRAP-type C4-dicarboxylate transport system, small permease component [Marinospirillum celere]|uniref:TRAP transporter small permease protein n=1 Tax=Marinospirillum celere TaxID=1122252 RepID=A0A1I1FPZ5_9GAMM|nr:TRAP transporter small permease [Marinospirillum celere]SFC01066.1 TRAP-type C4-dicarboxylate transport system, small permease component [Marinospirillum celere]